MKEKIAELRAKFEAALEKMKAMLTKAEEEKRDMTAEEEAEYAVLDASTDKIDRDIKRLEKLDAAEARAVDGQLHIPNFKKRTVPSEWRSFGEFLYAVRFNHNDPRLQDCEYKEWEERDLTMGTGTQGGFAVPTQFRPELLSVTPQQAIFRPRATVIPAGDPPDAKISMPALDQTAQQNCYGGVIMYKVGEGGVLTESNIRIKEVSLEPFELGGYIQVTDKLLRNWSAASPLIEAQLRKAMIGYEDTQFYSGNGVAGPTGIINSPCRIDVARATANAIAIADVRNMFARAKMGGSFFWVASQTILPQLMQLQGGNSENIYIFDAAKPIPNSLVGLPLMFADRSVALGTRGDLILVDASYYLIKDGSGPFVAASEHVAFLNGITTIKITWNVDGKAWLTAPLPLEGATTNTVSPFVVLN